MSHQCLPFLFDGESFQWACFHFVHSACGSDAHWCVYPASVEWRAKLWCTPQQAIQCACPDGYTSVHRHSCWLPDHCKCPGSLSSIQHLLCCKWCFNISWLWASMEKYRQFFKTDAVCSAIALYLLWSIYKKLDDRDLFCILDFVCFIIVSLRCSVFF